MTEEVRVSRNRAVLDKVEDFCHKFCGVGAGRRGGRGEYETLVGIRLHLWIWRSQT